MFISITKEQYEQIKAAEKVAKADIKRLNMFVPDLINGVPGIYKVIGYKKKPLHYFAEMQLIQKAESYDQAFIMLKKFFEKMHG